MAEIVNLNKARKAKKQADKSLQADANRAKYGRTKAGKLLDQAETKQRQTLLDGARRDGEDRSE